MSLYRYRAKVERIVDGDTAVLDIDLGMRVRYKASCRLAGVNAPEMSASPQGMDAKLWLVGRLLGHEVGIDSTGLDKYGRPIVTIYDPDTEPHRPAGSVNQEMIAAGHAVPYMTDR